jgi:hypothetical protein
MSVVTPVVADIESTSELQAAVRSLSLFGGERLGLCVSTGEGTDPEESNERVARRIAEQVFEAFGVELSWKAEDTRQFYEHTPEHIDGLHVDKRFIQVHTTHHSAQAIGSKVILREYLLPQKTEMMVRDAAEQYLRTGRRIDAIRDVPHTLFSSIKRQSRVVLRQCMVGRTGETLLFINGCPAESQEALTSVVSHECSSVRDGRTISQGRLVTFSRLEF